MKKSHFLAYRCQNHVMQGKCVMKGRREESMLSNCLSGLLEILGRDKVTRFVSDHETGQNSRKTPTLARRGEP